MNLGLDYSFLSGFTYMLSDFTCIYTYVSIRRKHSAVKSAITDSGAQHPQYVHEIEMLQDKMDHIEMRR